MFDVICGKLLFAYLEWFARQMLHVLNVYLVLKAILAVDAVAPKRAGDTLAKSVVATFGNAHNSR